MLKLVSFLALGVAVSLVSGHENHADHNHDHSESVNGKKVIHKTCASHTRSQKLMETNNDYKLAYQRERKHSREFIKQMKERKDRSFKKDMSSFKKEEGETLDKLKKDKDKEDKVRRLYSQYDEEYDNAPIIRIPLVYHVMYSTNRENLAQAQLESQTTVLNEDFRAMNTEILMNQVDDIWDDRIGDSKLEFYTNHTIRVQISDRSMCVDGENEPFKQSSAGGSDALDPKYYLNVWICNISSEGLLGYAYQPCLLDTDDEWRDGLVLGSDNVGSIDYDTDGSFVFGSSVYNLGRTGTHEIGHYLNLDHIWGTSSVETCLDSDDISDTPNQKGSNEGCPDTDTNSCNEEDPETGNDLRDMYENYMDYTNDECMFIFTEEQAWAMRSSVSGTGCRQEMYYEGVILDINQTLQPSSERYYPPPITCNDGCLIAEDFQNDGYCDCSECEDELLFTCITCTSSSASDNCPTECGDYGLQCTGDGVTTTPGPSSAYKTTINLSLLFVAIIVFFTI